ARHIDEAGDKALERVAPDEQRDALAFLQVEDADRDLEQFLFADLEQFVAREGVENVQQRLAVMAVWRQTGAPYRVLDLEPQQRDRPRAAAVGERGEQPGKQPDANDLAIPAKAADADRVHQRVTMNRGAPVGLGDQQQLAAPQKILH